MAKQKESKWEKPDKYSFHRYFGNKYIYAFKDNTLLIKSKIDPELFVVGLSCKNLQTAKELAKLLELNFLN